MRVCRACQAGRIALGKNLAEANDEEKQSLMTVMQEKSEKHAQEAPWYARYQNLPAIPSQRRRRSMFISRLRNS